MENAQETMTKPQAATVSPSLEIIPTGAAVGAEVRGIDLSQPISDDVAAALRAAWLDHIVLLFRDQAMTPEQYLRAASVFGKPQVGASRAYFEKADKLDSMHTLPVPEITVLSNLDRDGNPVKENDGLGSLEVIWHSDNSYIDQPPAGSTLYAREIPDDGTGKTSFNNQYRAYEELPDDLRQAIAGRCSKQDASRNSAGVLRPGIKKPETPEDVPGPMHPLVRVHPETGRESLYLGRRRVWPSQFIDGVPQDESEALLDRLWAHATQPKYAWTHTWRVGDMLVWDNRCALHYREPINSDQRRVMWRSQFQGEPVIAA
ncbi:MAG: TauD/TfdA family dioxygenase [Alphaproteobacteria bacterium]|nr:TauD/TfdA family dioxygenase [Alphaproteobacteria bacterium]